MSLTHQDIFTKYHVSFLCIFIICILFLFFFSISFKITQGYYRNLLCVFLEFDIDLREFGLLARFN